MAKNLEMTTTTINGPRGEFKLKFSVAYTHTLCSHTMASSYLCIYLSTRVEHLSGGTLTYSILLDGVVLRRVGTKPGVGHGLGHGVGHGAGHSLPAVNKVKK